MKNFLIGCIGLVLALAVSFFLAVGVFKIICWCFSLMFSWRLAVGFWVILLIMEYVFKKGDE